MNLLTATARALPPIDDERADFARDVFAGLAAEPKRLSPKYFYDARGSELFEKITQLPEYYPTRTEMRILSDRAGTFAEIIPNGAALIEFGAGATTKARLLLAVATIGAYVPVDISDDFLNTQAAALSMDYPELAVSPVAADFTQYFSLPAIIQKRPRVGFFPGSTIGNFEPDEARAFLARARQILGPDALMIVGTDLVKDEAVLHAAYNDTAGITAAFNLNLLHRINAELDGTFDVSAFAHRAIYNGTRQRIEMHLESLRAQRVSICGHAFAFRAGETIHTESSHKFTIESFQDMARRAGFTPRAALTDPEKFFAVHVLTA